MDRGIASREHEFETETSTQHRSSTRRCTSTGLCRPVLCALSVCVCVCVFACVCGGVSLCLRVSACDAHDSVVHDLWRFCLLGAVLRSQYTSGHKALTLPTLRVCPALVSQAQLFQGPPSATQAEIPEQVLPPCRVRETAVALARVVSDASVRPSGRALRKHQLALSHRVTRFGKANVVGPMRATLTDKWQAFK